MKQIRTEIKSDVENRFSETSIPAFGVRRHTRQENYLFVPAPKTPHLMKKIKTVRGKRRREKKQRKN